MRALTLLYPPECMVCRQKIEEEQHGLCPGCRSRLEGQMRALYCPAPENTDALVCAAPYDGRFRRAVLDLNFTIGMRMAGRLRSWPRGHGSCITCPGRSWLPACRSA